jgi:hypothetical protein
MVSDFRDLVCFYARVLPRLYVEEVRDVRRHRSRDLAREA